MSEQSSGGSSEAGELSYGKYLRILELLSLQTPVSSPPAHDELLFIVVHQSFELWFDLVLFELETVREALFTGRTFPARHYLKRVQAIERMLIEHLGIIESMSPQDFLQFRGYLSPASGFQSVQFREIEFISGLKEPGLLARLAATPEERERLERRLAEPTLWDAFRALLEANGLPMPSGEDNVEDRHHEQDHRDQQQDRPQTEFHEHPPSWSVCLVVAIMHSSQTADRLWAGRPIEERALIFRSPHADVSIPEVPLTPFVLQRAAKLGDKAALIDGPTGRTLSFSQLTGTDRSVAGGLAGRG